MPILDYRKGTVLSPAGHDCIREALMLSEFYNVAEGIGARELLRPLGRARQTCKDRSSGAIRRCGQPCWVCGRERVLRSYCVGPQSPFGWRLVRLKDQWDDSNLFCSFRPLGSY